MYQKITWDEITASSLDNDQPNLGGEGDTGSKLNELIRKEMSKDAVYQDR